MHVTSPFHTREGVGLVMVVVVVVVSKNKKKNVNFNSFRFRPRRGAACVAVTSYLATLLHPLFTTPVGL